MIHMQPLPTNDYLHKQTFATPMHPEVQQLHPDDFVGFNGSLQCGKESKLHLHCNPPPPQQSQQ
jgi:hypothetical protein